MSRLFILAIMVLAPIASNALDTDFIKKYEGCFQEVDTAFREMGVRSNFFLRDGQIVVNEPDGLKAYSEDGLTVVNGHPCTTDHKIKPGKGLARLIGFTKPKNVSKAPTYKECKKVDDGDIQAALAKLDGRQPTKAGSASSVKSAQ